MNSQTVLFLTIQYIIHHLFAHTLNVKQFYWPIHKTLTGATPLGKRRPGCNDKKSQKWQDWNLAIKYFGSYKASSLGEVFPSIEKLSVNFTAPGLCWKITLIKLHYMRVSWTANELSRRPSKLKIFFKMILKIITKQTFSTNSSDSKQTKTQSRIFNQATSDTLSLY